MTDVNVSVAGGTVTVKHDGRDADALRGRVARLGYKVTGIVKRAEAAEKKVD